jgi:hypothetical protein
MKNPNHLPKPGPGFAEKEVAAVGTLSLFFPEQTFSGYRPVPMGSFAPRVNVATPGVVRILNDIQIAGAVASIGALPAASILLSYYLKTTGRDLAISPASLAAELVGHIWPDKLLNSLLAIPFLPPFARRFLQEVKRRLGVIDCGERHLDSNRFIWDLLAFTVRG